MSLRTLKLILKYLLSIFFVLAGLNHFITPAIYLKIMPPYLPWHHFLVALSGAVEIALGAALLVRRFRVVAAWGLIALLLAIFPANIQMALNPELYPQFSRAALLVRLPLQAVLIAWAYWYTRPGTVRAVAPHTPPDPRILQPNRTQKTGGRNRR
jgi:uncharacterized membrane protein